MGELIEAFFREMEYHKIPSNINEVTLFFKPEHSYTLVIMLIKDREGLPLAKRDFIKLKKTSADFFVEKKFPEAHLMTIIVTENTEKAIQIGEDDRFFWMISESMKKILVFEDKVADFYGLKESLAEWIMKERVETIQKPDLKPIKKRFQNEWVNKSIVFLNILIFIITSFTGNWMYEVGALNVEGVLGQNQYYRFLTAIFLHGSSEHIMSNMIMLYVAGKLMEEVLGHKRYAILYFLSGIGGGLLSLWLQVVTGSTVGSVGASGAIFGIIGGLLYVTLRNKGRIAYVSIGRLCFMIAYLLYSGFVSTNVDNAGHLGGLMSGFLIAILLYEMMNHAESKSLKSQNERKESGCQG